MNDSLAALARLRDLLAEPAPEPTEVERTLSRIHAAALNALHGGDRAALDALWRPLRRMYEILAARAPDAYETDPVFLLGRVVEQVEFLAAARERTQPAEVAAIFAQENARDLLAQLEGGPRTSSELERALGWEKSNVSRRLKRLVELNLITSRRAGQTLVSRLTPLGEQALRDFEAAPPAKVAPPAKAAPRETHWNFGSFNREAVEKKLA